MSMLPAYTSAPNVLPRHGKHTNRDERTGPESACQKARNERLVYDILWPDTRQYDSPVEVLCDDLDSALGFAIPKTDLLEIPYIRL